MTYPNVKAKIRQVGQSFMRFCGTTSIHGLRYIGERDINWWQRAAWVVVFVGGILFSTVFCMQMWQKWEDSPVLMSLDTIRYPLSNIPFPAVTICSVNKVSQKRLEIALLSDPRLRDVPFKVMQRTLRYMTKLDRAIENDHDLAHLSGLFRSINVTSKDLFDLFKRTAPTCSDIVVDCRWQSGMSSCIDYLSFLPTDDGLCCVFNGANYSDPDLGFQFQSPEPLIASGSGCRQGLKLVLNAEIDDYSITNQKYDGFKVLIHASQKFPDVADRGFVLSPGYEVFAGINGISAITGDDVAQKIPPRKRKCRANGERDLLYFPRYSQSGCVTECAARLIRERHHCRPFFLRAETGTPLCDMDLYANITEIYVSVRQTPEHPDINCDCPPPCADEWFEPEISYSTFPGRGFNLSRTFKRLSSKLNLSGIDVQEDTYFKSNVAVLNVYYKDWTGIRYKTDIRFGIEDFISAMGGLLSLGLGMSFISAVELLYFVFLRCLWPSSRSTAET